MSNNPLFTQYYIIIYNYIYTVNDCDPVYKPTDAIVPIAVGAALAGMVIIVLVGYCIGRRKTRAGYQNMNA